MTAVDPIVVREDRRRTLTIEFVGQSIAIMDRWSDDEADPDPLWLTPNQAEDLAAALLQAAVTARKAADQ